MPSKEFPAYLFLGEEDFLKDQKIKEMKAQYLSPATISLNYSAFYTRDKDFDIKEMLDNLNTMPFMSNKRMVVLKDVDSLPDSGKESVLLYLKKARDTSIFIIDSRSNVIRGEFLLEASKLAELCYCRKLTEGELDKWLAKRSLSYGKKITQEAINLIKGNLSHELSILDASIVNLSLYVDKRPGITVSDVERLISVNPLNDSFDLLNAIGKKDANKALVILNSLQKQKKKEIEFLGLLSWQFRMLLRVKGLVNIKTKADICKEIGIYYKKLDELIQYSAKFQKKQIAGFLKDILKADEDIKTSSFPARMILERLIVRMCL
jgi:DNA polymerase-3 subunit delta